MRNILEVPIQANFFKNFFRAATQFLNSQTYKRILQVPLCLELYSSETLQHHACNWEIKKHQKVSQLLTNQQKRLMVVKRRWV
jgi:hypothetical protein